jgi:hypothetical protein
MLRRKLKETSENNQQNKTRGREVNLFPLFLGKIV